jgi:general secretion pathway protein G
MRYRLRTLLLVLAVAPPLLAIIAVVVAPHMGWHSRQSLAQQHVALFQDAVQMYCIDTGELPSSLADLVTMPAGLKKPASWAGPYLERQTLPLDPWNKPYHYKATDPAAGKFRVWSTGPDGRDGTSDDIATGS